MHTLKRQQEVNILSKVTFKTTALGDDREICLQQGKLPSKDTAHRHNHADAFQACTSSRVEFCQR